MVGAIVGAAVAIVSGNLWLGFQAYSMTSSVINAATSGNWGGLAGGIAGGLIGGAFGWQAGTAGGALFSNVNTFWAGFATGAIEQGAIGFGGAFGYSLGSGESFSDSLSAGLTAGAVSGAIGGVVQGAYQAGWQNAMHGASMRDVLTEKGVARETELYRGYSDIGFSNKWHEGIEIADNYREISGRWEFDTLSDPISKYNAATGKLVTGAWKIRAGPFASTTSVSKNYAITAAAYGDIQSQLGIPKIYHISGFPSNCRTEAERVISRALEVGG